MKRFHMFEANEEGSHLNEEHAIFLYPIFDTMLIIASNSSNVKPSETYTSL